MLKKHTIYIKLYIELFDNICYSHNSYVMQFCYANIIIYIKKTPKTSNFAQLSSLSSTTPPKHLSLAQLSSFFLFFHLAYVFCYTLFLCFSVSCHLPLIASFRKHYQLQSAAYVCILHCKQLMSITFSTAILNNHFHCVYLYVPTFVFRPA